MHLQSLHTHSLYDDGRSTLEDMLQSAITHGLSAFGFSGHSPLPFANDWAIRRTGSPNTMRIPAGCRRSMQASSLSSVVWNGTIAPLCPHSRMTI